MPALREIAGGKLEQIAVRTMDSFKSGSAIELRIANTGTSLDGLSWQMKY